MAKDLIIIGASGFGREVAWLVERINSKENTWNLLGFIDDNRELQGTEINGYKVLGTLATVRSYPDAYFVVAIGAAKTREKIIKNNAELFKDTHWATLVDPSVEMSNIVEIGEGSIICAHTILTVNIKIGCHVIINLDCTIGHDDILDDFVTLYPSVNVSGNCHIEKCVEMGTGMQIIQGRNIGEYTIVGAGAVVIKDLPSNCTAVGAPAKAIKFNE